MKAMISGLAILVLVLSLATCSAGGLMNGTLATVDPAACTPAAASSSSSTVATTESLLAALHAPAADDATIAESENAVPIVLSGASIEAGDGVTVDGSTATITAAGAYRLSGTLDDGQLVVDTADEEPVHLILDGVTLRNSTSAPLFVRKAAAVVIVLAGDTQNVVEDGAVYLFADPAEDEPNAALFTKADLTIAGSGALHVIGNYNDGIASKDGLILRAAANA